MRHRECNVPLGSTSALAPPASFDGSRVWRFSQSRHKETQRENCCVLIERAVEVANERYLNPDIVDSTAATDDEHELSTGASW